MQIQFTGSNYEPSSDVVEMTKKKLAGLNRSLGKDGENAKANVILGKATEAHQNGKIWQAEINLACEGKTYNAKAVRENIKPAINAASAELFREVRRTRSRAETRKRRGGFELKNLFRFGRS